jgi:hypothetical protein
LMFFSQFYPSIFVWLRILFFFSSMPLIRSCKSHDPGNSSGGLAQFEKKINIFVVSVLFFLYS